MIIDPKVDISARLRELREATGFSFREIAMRCASQGVDVDPSTIYVVAKGGRTRFDIGVAILNLYHAHVINGKAPWPP